jgi:dipeptidyl-peptidase-4
MLVTLILITLGVNSLFAQDSLKLSLENMSDPALFQAFRMPRVSWLKDNSALIFDTRKPAGERVLERMDPRTGKRKTFLNPGKVRESFEALFPEGKAPRLSPVPQQVARNGRYAFYLVRGDIFILNIGGKSFIRATETDAVERSIRFSPDGTKLAFIRQNDIYVYDIKTGKEIRLTRDGSETLLNGTLSWVYWEEVFGRSDIGYWWSDDSKAIAYLQTDESEISLQSYVDIEPWTPTVTTQRYPKVGETNPLVRVGIAEVGGGETVWAKLDTGAYEYIMRVDWLPDSRRICIRVLNRLQTELDMYFADRYTGAARFILKDINAGWINMTDDLYFLKDGKHLIMSSERDGYEHLYRFTLNGELVNQITRGEWSIRSSGGGVFWVRRAVTGINEDRGWIYFTALKESSLERHLYRVRFDGTGMERLTKEAGTHAITMSPDTRYYFDRFSDIDTPPSLSLYRTGGSIQSILAEPDPGALEKYNAQFPELIQIPARDGFLLPASITRPADFDPSMRYPVIVYVYGGPSAPQVSNAFSYNVVWENVLLNAGYICMKIDNRAATGISKTLENLLLKRTPGEVELNDLVDAVRWMKQKSYIDPDRFGVWGWSGGGTNTILLMTRSEEFKAGIAGAGVTDFRFYDTKWAEAAMKTEKENREGYEKNSLLNYAKDLHGKLMIIHGTHDDNVHIQNTWRFVNKLIEANKLFELMIYPMRKHGVGDPRGRAHLNHTMLDFWERNL